MIVFDLKCGSGHIFEAWFGSSAAYDAQLANGQLRCPFCDDCAVTKAAMAPNIAAKGNAALPPPSIVKGALQALAMAQAKALEGSTWVGKGFAGRARAMHFGEESKTAIHGQATIAEAKELVSEGVALAPLPLPIVPPENVN